MDGIIITDFFGSEWLLDDEKEYLDLLRGDVVRLEVVESGWAFGEVSPGWRGWFPTQCWQSCSRLMSEPSILSPTVVLGELADSCPCDVELCSSKVEKQRLLADSPPITAKVGGTAIETKAKQELLSYAWQKVSQSREEIVSLKSALTRLETQLADQKHLREEPVVNLVRSELPEVQPEVTGFNCNAAEIANIFQNQLQKELVSFRETLVNDLIAKLLEKLPHANEGITRHRARSKDLPSVDEGHEAFAEVFVAEVSTPESLPLSLPIGATRQITPDPLAPAPMSRQISPASSKDRSSRHSVLSNSPGRTSNSLSPGKRSGRAIEIDIEEELEDEAGMGIPATPLCMTPDPVDSTKLKLKDNSSIGNIFSYDVDLDKPPYNVDDHLYAHGIFQALARNTWFSGFTTIMVILNAIYIAFDSQYNNAKTVYHAEWFFFLASQSFCIWFTFEIVVRFFAFVSKCDSLKDGWFKFDLFLVATMVLDIWFLQPVIAWFAGDAHMPVPTQPLRLLRLFKLTRMARLMSVFPEIITMIKSLAHSLRAIASSMVLVALMTYTWSILLHTLMKKEDDFNTYVKTQFDYDFSSILSCMWVLLMAGTLMLDNTAPLLYSMLWSGKPLIVVAGFSFLLFAFLSALLILQMLIGMLCDVVLKTGEDRKNAETIGLMKQELLGEFQRLGDQDGRITQSELLAVLNNDASLLLFNKLKINRLFLTSMACLLYPPGDDTVKIPTRTILELMIMCKGDNQATVQIIASALCYLSTEISNLRRRMVQHLTVLTGDLEGELAGELDRAGSRSFRVSNFSEDITSGPSPTGSKIFS